MDKYNLDIAIIGNTDIIDFIDSVNDIDRLSIFAKNVEIDNISAYKDADVVILDESMLASFDKILKNKAEYAFLVLICNRESFRHISQKDKFFDIWIDSDQDSSVYAYRIEQFLKRMRNVLDAELAQKQLDVLIDSVPDLIWYKDVIGAHIKVNNSFCKTVNKTKEQIKYRGHYYIWDLDYEEYQKGEFVCMETEEIVIKEQKTFLFDEKVKIGDELRQLKTYKSAILNRRGETIGTVGLARDVTDIWNTHAEFKSLIDHLPFPMMILSSDYEFVSSNSNFDAIFGEQDPENFKLSDFSKKFFALDISMKDTLDGIVACQMKDHDKLRYFSTEKSAIYDVFNQLHGFFYIFNDETMKKEYEQKLKSLSRTDELTGIANRKGLRHYFEKNFNRVVKTQSSFSFMVMDIDFFKQLNDIYGHVQGDEILVIMGSILRELNDEHNLFVARYGGEEFILAAENKSLEESKEIATLLTQKLAEYKLEHKGSSVSENVTLSLGLAYYPQIPVGKTVAQIIKEADELLYEAKRNGRNQIIANCF